MNNVISCIIKEGVGSELALVIVSLVGLIGLLGYLLHSNQRQVRVLSEQQKLLHASEARYRLICQKSNDIIFEYDLHGDYMVYSENLGGLALQELHGDFLEYAVAHEIVSVEDAVLLRDTLNRAIQEQCCAEATLRVRMASGDYLWHQVSLVSVVDDKNAPWRVVGRARNVEKQKREEERLQEKASRDPLTKLLNKLATRKAVDRMLEQGGDTVDAFLIIDVDYFKQINDTRGHSTGDNVLTAAACGLRGLFRSSDILGRIGGDEMVVFCRDIKNSYCAEQRAAEVCELFRTLRAADESPLAISCSVGIALAPQDGSSFNQLYINADLALYAAKAAGRNRYEVYSPQMSIREKQISER